MSWLDKQPIEVLQIWARNASIPLLVSGSNGEIYWVNQAFEEWSGYTLPELVRLGWKNLSKPDESLEADLKSLAEIVDGYRTHYTVQKYYIPKGDKPQLGELSVVRYPNTGTLEFFLCTWVPLKNGTAAAFELAIKTIGEVDKSVAQLSSQVSKLSNRNEDEDWVVSTIRLVKRYPKLAATVLALILSVFGVNNILELLQRLSYVGVPVPPKVQETDVLQLPLKPENPDTMVVIPRGRP